MKTGPNLLVLMILSIILALIPKRIRFRRQRAAPSASSPRSRKGAGSRITWTARDEAEWKSGRSDNQ